MSKRGLMNAQALIAQTVRADLDGDGTDEVIVVAEPASEESRVWGLVFLRRIVDGRVVSQPVWESFLPDAATGAEAGYKSLFRVGAVADLNGDGSMEVVIESRWATHVYAAFDDGTLREVLSGGCRV